MEKMKLMSMMAMFMILLVPVFAINSPDSENNLDVVQEQTSFTSEKVEMFISPVWLFITLLLLIVFTKEKR
jgi:hypothetical protein